MTTENINTKLLLTPGPVTINPNVVDAFSNAYNLHHSSDRFKQIALEIEQLIRECFCISDRYRIIFSGMSGSGSVESMLRVTKAFKNKRVLVIENGHFGKRLVETCKKLNIEHDLYSYSYYSEINENNLRTFLNSHKDYGAIAIVHNETSVGQVNNIKLVRKIADIYGLKLLVDMVSSFGGECFNFNSISPDIAVTTSGKALNAFAGISITFMTDKLINDNDLSGYNEYYMNLLDRAELYNNHKEILFSPPVALYTPLLRALKNIKEESLSKKLSRHKICLNKLENFIINLGFSPLITNNPSNTVRTFKYTNKQNENFERFNNILNNSGYYIYQNKYYHAPENYFQVSTMGFMSVRDIEELINKFYYEVKATTVIPISFNIPQNFKYKTIKAY